VKIVMVGEAWGRRESEFKHPLVGPSGRELTLEMGISGLAPYMTMLCRSCKRETRFTNPRCEHCQESIWPNEFTLVEHWKQLRGRHEIAVTNVFNAWPPILIRRDNTWIPCKPLIVDGPMWSLEGIYTGEKYLVDRRDCVQNDLGGFFSTVQETEMAPWKASKRVPGTHLKKEYMFHVTNLYNEINALRPTLIIALGNAACWAILGSTKISALRGTVAWSNRLGVKTLPTFHPAAVLRQPVMRVSVIADLRKASREAEFPEIRRPERFITIIDPTDSGLRDGYDWFLRPARAYAVDIETRRGQITMVGFARSASDALVIQFRNENGDPNYWPTSELEFAAWKLAIHGLATATPKIFQNGVYDLSYFIRMGIHVKNVAHDTMLWSHSEFIELPKSLGYLGSIYANEVAWKSMVRHGENLKRDE
jgi:uracil-DNA glycosylase